MADDLFTKIEFDIMEALDNVMPKYWTPGLVEAKPATYTRECRRVIRSVLEKHIHIEKLTDQSSPTKTNQE